MTSPQTERQQSVLDLLQNLKGRDPLKKLFWTELNYDKVNSPLSRKGWSEQASSALADDPMLFATGGKDFHVIHARLKADRPLIGVERPVVSRLLQDHPYALFIFSNANQDQWHFLNVKYDDDVQKRRLFRRITVGPLEKLRTASERLDKINLADAPNVAPNTIQKLHDDAFDVEPVTKEFFREYGRIFGDVEGDIKGIRDAERKRLFTQRLFNRLMFVAFIQKKGWLKFDGSRDYLSALWRAYQQESTVSDKNFFRDRLKPLFFFGLNSANDVNQIGINRGGFLKTLIGDVPYLNGGLFDEDDDDKDTNIIVPDKALGAVLNDLFSRFNFTVTESTPLDIEVAVDPEMLGKIFEELVTGRHETGSYYTPKPIVAFMCREALKGYLEAQLPNESKVAIEEFVDEHEPGKLHNAEAVLEALRRIRVCDPACGSGAYLVGMQHELLDLRACLFATAKLDARSVYDRKLEIIQNNLYGVDLDQFAINIARLRLWLSLSVDFEGATPPPLPNLDYKVEVGDSITAPDPSGGLEQGFRKTLVDDFLSLKAQYLTVHGGKKLAMRKEIAKLRDTISGWAHGKGLVNGFDWPVEFAEVFTSGGFDVVITNPPYVRQELIKSQKTGLKALYPDVYCGTADLYCYFYARAVQLLKSHGILTFISSNKWFFGGYGAKLRKFISETCAVQSVTDFGDLPVFEGATAYPMIFIAQKGESDRQVLFTEVKSLDAPYPDVLALVKRDAKMLPRTALKGAEWRFTNAETARRLVTMQKSGLSLGEYVNGRIYYGIKTGLNEAFVIDARKRAELIADDPKSAELIKPWVSGKDVRRWFIKASQAYVIFTRRGVDIDAYPAIKRYLAGWKAELTPKKTGHEPRGRKPGSYKWYEIQDEVAYYAVFEKPKIVVPGLMIRPTFALANSNAHVNVPAVIIGLSDKFLLGVLNSSALWSFFENITIKVQQGYLRIYIRELASVPIPDASVVERAAIERLVSKCLDAKGIDCESWEREINERVAALYGIEAPDVASALSPNPAI